MERLELNGAEMVAAVIDRAVLEGIDRWVSGQIAATGTPGLTLAITDRDELVHEAAFGLADVGARTAMTSDHLLETGSIGKSFTAIALLQLMEEGKVDLDRPVTDVLPWFSIHSEFAPITLHHLLTHTAGITCGLDFTPDPIYQVWALRDSVATAPPGARFHYSNIGYKVVGAALEAIAGAPYGEVVRQRIFAPLGLEAAEPTIHHGMRHRMAVGYGPLSDDRPWWPARPLAPATWLETDSADGCMAMTAAQLATYLRMLLNRGAAPGGRVLSPAGFERFTRRWIQREEGDQPAWYGYGITTRLVDGHTSIGHGGGMVGYFAGMIGDLETGHGVTVLVNGPGEPNRIARQVLDHLRSHLAGDPRPLPARSDPWADVTASDYAGTYGAGDGQVTVAPEPDGTLTLVHGGARSALVPFGTDAFVTTDPLFDRFPLRFEREGDAIAGFTSGGDVYRRPGCADVKVPELPEEWRAFPGHYRSHNPWTTGFRVVARRGRLWLILAAEPDGLEPEQPLVPLGDGRFRCGEEAWFPERIRFDTIVEGVALRATLSGADFYRNRHD